MPNLSTIEKEQLKRNSACLIKPYHEGPDMPLNAAIMARLPLKVLRRVLPEMPHSFYLNIIDTQVLKDCFSDVSELRYIDSFYKDIIVFELDSDEDCPDCGGEGWHLIGSHDHECEQCDGTGKGESYCYARIVLTTGGTIIWNKCKGVKPVDGY